MVQNDEVTGLLSYIGKKGTVIRFDSDKYHWEMVVMNNKKIKGISHAELSTLLIGKSSWKIIGDFSCSAVDQELELSLGSCTEEQFTCTDGVCIDIASRCDNINDCYDKSDETNCKRVKTDKTYQKFIVPPPVGEEERTDVTVGMDLESIMDINEVNGHFQVQFFLFLSWFDTRLRFQNLKEDIDLNSFLPSKNDKIWTPELVFENTGDRVRTETDEETIIKVIRKGDFVPSKIDENENIQYFKGSENLLTMKRFYNQIFHCKYQMAWYPFDIQRCKLIMTMKGSFAPFTNLIVQRVNYKGEQFLTKYEVKATKMFLTKWEEKDAVVVEVTLGRELLSVLMNVIIPTLLLNIISVSTNYYKDEFFESVIGINLTSMLVLVALFVGVSRE